MSTSSDSTPATRRRFLSELEHPSHAFRHIGPNWFAAVMGTGIVANAAILVPHQVPGLHSFALGVWIVAALLLAILGAATAMHWLKHPDRARAHISEPKMAPFYGAPPMAMLTVGAGAVLVGKDLIGLDAAVALDFVLWTAGTLTGLAASVVVPVFMFVRHRLTPEDAFATWLMPVVPPMVSAATGAALIPHLPEGGAQLTMLFSCYSLFGLSLLVSLVTITLVWYRLIFHDLGPVEMVPTLWIVLGPLGQSITAVGLLAAQAGGVIEAPYGTAFDALGVLYGVPMLGFALLWFAIAASITIRALGRGLTFSLTWWSFTFPVGTVVTGTSVLAGETGEAAIGWLAMGLYAFLLIAWFTALTNTLRGAWSGKLLLAPETPSRRDRDAQLIAFTAMCRTPVALGRRLSLVRPARR